MDQATHFLRDILREPAELSRSIEHLSRDNGKVLAEAAEAVRAARHIYITGIGASWHAALNAGSQFHLGGLPVYLMDASELLHCSEVPSNSVIVILSRSGRSIEIVGLLAKARANGTTVVGVTNGENEPLARDSQFPIVVPVGRDHGISVNTYSSLVLGAGLLASIVLGKFSPILTTSLSNAVAKAGLQIADWRAQMEGSRWFVSGAPYYFLARGSSFGSCHEARLLWEEGVKAPATSMGTGNFRHGPQEIVREGSRFCMWIDSTRMREEDLATARDLRRLGASVMLIGYGIPSDAADLVFQLPKTPENWQALIDIIPAQLAAEYLSRLGGVDCDSFRVCSYVVETEGGLLPAESTSSLSGASHAARH